MSDVVLICPLCEEDEDGDLDDPEEFATEPEMVSHLASEHSLLMAQRAIAVMPSTSLSRLLCNGTASDRALLLAHLRQEHAVSLAYQWAAKATPCTATP